MKMQSLICHEDEDAFSSEYHKKCIDTYLQSGEVDGVFLRKTSPGMRLERLFCTEFSSEHREYLSFYIDDVCWMSLTPLEMESHWVPIVTAQTLGGHIGVGGLGMGHFLLNIMSHSKIDKITVYEKDQRVIDFWCSRFSAWEGFKKIDFICADVRDELDMVDSGTFDFFYMDIYLTLLPDDVFKDAENYSHVANHYFFWGLEKVVFDLLWSTQSDSMRLVRDTIKSKVRAYNPLILDLIREFFENELSDMPYAGTRGYEKRYMSSFVSLMIKSKSMMDEYSVPFR